MGTKRNVKTDPSAEGDAQQILDSIRRIVRELRVSARSAADARRLEEIQKELGEVGQRYMTAKDDKEREAIQKRLMELSQEQQRLQGDGPVAVPVDDDEPAPPR